jgi:glucose/arabinose dehydrogenase
LHPDFGANPWVYVAHTYSGDGGTRNRVVRMRYANGALGEPEVLLDGIPGSSIHNGSRLAVGPDRLLYVTTGDASNGEQSQDRASLAGKILRLTLEGEPAPGNPLGTAVFSFGHRNAQGLAFAPGGTLYASEHGPGDNDEVNVIRGGGNYGWPDVHGKCDGNEAAFCQANDVVEPLITWTPTIAPAGIAYYDSDRISGWRGSLLMTTLKGSALYRLTLSSDGAAITAAEPLFDDAFGRLRDVLVAPDGIVYLATSNRDGRGRPRDGDDRIVRVGR